MARDTDTTANDSDQPNESSSAVFFESWRPRPALAPFVNGITGYLEYEAGVPHQRQSPGVSTVPMIFVLNAGWDYQVGDQRQALGSSFVAGLRSTPVTMISNGFAVCLQVDFTPRGARGFLGIDMHELSEQIYPLDSVLGRFSNLLEERLAGINHWADRFGVLEELLVERLLTQTPNKSLHSNAVATALAVIEQQPEPVSVTSLASECGVSRKHLVDLFAREVGITPSRYLQLTQFETALKLMHGNPQHKLVDVAYHCGYSDQAHFSRQFRRFMNQSPVDYLADQAGS